MPGSKSVEVGEAVADTDKGTARAEGVLGLDVVKGLAEGDLDRAADLAAEVAPQTPAPIDRAQIRELLGRAMDGGATGLGNGT